MDQAIQKNSRVRPSFQILLIIISLSIISYALYIRFYNFYSYDESPQVLLLTPEKQKEFGAFPVNVRIGLYIKNFSKFDMVANEFEFDGIIWFLFDVGEISLSTLERFQFDPGEIIYRSPPYVKFIKDKLFVSYNIRVKFSSNLSFSDFPVDDHRLYLMLVHKFVRPSEMIFTSEQKSFNIASDKLIQGWERIHSDVQSGYGQDILEPNDPSKTLTYPIVVFNINFQRANIRYTMSILLPLLLIFYLCLFGFTVSVGESWKIAIGSITATLAYRFIIENLSPRVGYFMISDYIFMTMLMSCGFAFTVMITDTFYIPFKQWQLCLFVFVLQAAVTISLSCLFIC